MNKQDVAFDQLISDIQSSIDGKITGSGFYSVHCPMCENKNQPQRKGGFKFDVDKVGYSCFRGSCDANTVYTLGEGIPRKFRDLMDEIGVKIPIELRARKRKRQNALDAVDERFEKNVYKSLTFPKFFSEDLPERWIDYLVGRMVIYHDLDYRYVTEGDFKGSLVIPHYYYDKLIGWDYITSDGKYITATESNEAMIFLPTKVPPKRPILVEGMHDALCFPNTVGTKNAKVTRKQAYHLRHSDPIVLPDRSGSKLYETAKAYGWDVCIPMWKEKDLNEAVKKRGILVAAKMIHDGTMKVGPRAEILYKRWTGKK